jgi:hypothetical protein
MGVGIHSVAGPLFVHGGDSPAAATEMRPPAAASERYGFPSRSIFGILLKSIFGVLEDFQLSHDSFARSATADPASDTRRRCALLGPACRPSSLEEGSVWLHLAGARGHICISNRFSDPEIDPPIHQTDQIFEPGPRGRLYPSNAPTKSGQTAFRYPVIYAQGFRSSISLRFFRLRYTANRPPCRPGCHLVGQTMLSTTRLHPGLRGSRPRRPTGSPSGPQDLIFLILRLQPVSFRHIFGVYGNT